MRTGFVIRPILETDFSALWDLLCTIEDGLASLPPNKQQIKELLANSIEGFSNYRADPTAFAYYLFVLEDLHKEKIIGTCGIRIPGGIAPYFYIYEKGCVTRKSSVLGYSKSHQYLRLKGIRKRYTEVGSLYLHKDYRGLKIGRFLALSRYLYLGLFQKRFGNEIVANLRGYRETSQVIPFWDHWTHHFTPNDFNYLDSLKTLGEKAWIPELLPQDPVYLECFGEKVQKIIGQVHVRGRGARHLLLEQGFEQTDWVDILDAGPYFKASLKNIAILKQCSILQVVESLPTQKAQKTQPVYLLSNLKDSLEFKVTWCHAQSQDNYIHLPRESQQILGVRPTDCVFGSKLS